MFCSFPHTQYHQMAKSKPPSTPPPSPHTPQPPTDPLEFVFGDRTCHRLNRRTIYESSLNLSPADTTPPYSVKTDPNHVKPRSFQRDQSSTISCRIAVALVVHHVWLRWKFRNRGPLRNRAGCSLGAKSFLCVYRMFDVSLMRRSTLFLIDRGHSSRTGVVSS